MHGPTLRLGTIPLHFFQSEDSSAIILIATWFREGPAMTQELDLKHCHPEETFSLTSIFAYQWFVETRKYSSHFYANDWKTAWKVGLMHHVMNAIYESVQVLAKAVNEHKETFPQVPKRQFGCPGYSTLLLHLKLSWIKLG